MLNEYEKNLYSNRRVTMAAQTRAEQLLNKNKTQIENDKYAKIAGAYQHNNNVTAYGMGSLTHRGEHRYDRIKENTFDYDLINDEKELKNKLNLGDG